MVELWWGAVAVANMLPPLSPGKERDLEDHRMCRHCNLWDVSCVDIRHISGTRKNELPEIKVMLH
jgi:hypothetical protein